MTEHPSFADLVDRTSEPDVALHLSQCAPCRAQLRLVESLDGESFPGLDAARGAMARARIQASRHLSRSMSGTADDRSDPHDLEPGRVLDRYTVEALVGRGGMGTVYRVRHNQLLSQHALKVLHRTSSSVRSRLIREGRAQSRLRHPHVVPVTDIVDVDGAPGLIMEYVDGPSLAQWLRREGRPGLEEAERLATQILRGVCAAHAVGLVHRDLKPANVILAPHDEGDWMAKVADFGLARELDDLGDADLTGSHTPLGTPAYMAPEQIRDASRADARSDIFSLGAVLYELVAGRRAFDGIDLVTIYDKVRAGDYRPLSEVAPDLPVRIRDTIERALQVDPARRFATCDDLLAAWRGTETETPREATVSLAPHVSPLRSAPFGALLAAALMLAAVGVGIGGVAVWLLGNDTPSGPVARVAEPRERQLTAQPDDLQIYAATLSPDGERVAFTDGEGIKVQAVKGGTARLLVAGGPYHNLDWFPDDQRLLASGWDEGKPGTWTVDADTGALTRLSDRTGRFVRLSPDGTKLAVADRGGVFVTSLDGTERTRVRPLTSGDGTSGLVWSPDGQFLAGVHDSLAGKGAWLEVSAADGSSSRRLVEHNGLAPAGIAAVAWIQPDRLLYTLSEGRDGEVSSSVWALDGASTAVDGDAARLVHTWEGFTVLRLQPSADASRFVTSRVTTAARVYLLDLLDPGPLERVTTDDWQEVPAGWLDDDALLVSSARGGGGLFVRDLATSQTRLIQAFHGMTRRADVVDGGVVFGRDAGPEGHEYEEAVAEWVPLDGGPSRELLRLKVGPDKGKAAGHLYGMRCRGQRCLLSKPQADEIRFQWLDVATGEQTPFLVMPLQGRMSSWDLSPDGNTLALLTADPPTLTFRDLLTGEIEPRPGTIAAPYRVAWMPGGDSVLISGLDEASPSPYVVQQVWRDGRTRTLWTSMTWFASLVAPSPDGRRAALGINAFDDDLWLVEGLDTPAP